MTSQGLETYWLSLRVWLKRCVLPSAITLALLVASLRLFLRDGIYRDQTSLIFGFFMLYFVLVRGGHMLMIRSMHFDLKKTYGDKYAQRLKRLPTDLRRNNIGFTLARIKRELIDAQNHKSRR